MTVFIHKLSVIADPVPMATIPGPIRPHPWSAKCRSWPTFLGKKRATKLLPKWNVNKMKSKNKLHKMAKRKSQPRLNWLTETVRRRRRCQKKETSRQLYDGNKPKSPTKKKNKKNASKDDLVVHA